VLVDEIKKLPRDQQSAALDCLCSWMQSDLYKGLPTMVVASCLDVDSIFDVVTRGSKRPLFSLPVTPCPVGADGMDRIMRLFESCSIVKQQFAQVLDKDIEESVLLQFEHDLHGTGGHYRSIKHLWEQRVTKLTNLDDFRSPFPASPHRSDFAIDVLSKLITGKNRVQETSILLNDRDGTTSTARYVIDKNYFGVFIQSVDVRTRTIDITIAPSALRFKSCMVNDYPLQKQGLVKLLKTIGEGVVNTGNWEKRVERLFPMVEMVHAYMWNKLPQSTPATADDLYGAGNYVYRPWDGESPVLEISRGFKDVDLFPIEEEKCSTDVTEEETMAEEKKKRIKEEKIKKGRELIEKAARDAPSTPGRQFFAFPKVDNFPNVEGIVTNFIFGKDALVQMKIRQDMWKAEAVKYIQNIHGEAADRKLPQKSYIAVLYTTVDLTKIDPSTLPPGSLIVGPRALERLLNPFGISPFLQRIKAKAVRSMT